MTKRQAIKEVIEETVSKEMKEYTERAGWGTSRERVDRMSEVIPLIMAAPELLSACQRALAVLVSARELACSEPMMDTPLVTNMQCAGGAVMALRNAISKATGG